MSRVKVEVERRFLLRLPQWNTSDTPTGDSILQVYLIAEQNRAIRIRIRRNRAILTVKGETVGAARPEIECEIEMDAARAIIDANLYTGTPIEKTRTRVVMGELEWDVDHFDGANAGLAIAEVEFDGDAADRDAWERRVDAERPSWLGREITDDYRFSNSQLALRPFSSWPASVRDDVLREMGVS